MIRKGYLSAKDRKDLIALARDGACPSRLTRRANALLLLDDGMSCQQVANVLYFDDDTVRRWYELFITGGVDGLTHFDVGGSACQLSDEQLLKLKAWVIKTLPRTTREIGAYILREFGVCYESRSGLILLLHRLGLSYRKPKIIPRKLDPQKQQEFIALYQKILNSLSTDEVILFGDAVHPTHSVRPAGCWGSSEESLAVEQTSGRQRMNIHGAIDLETGHTQILENETVDAQSTLKLLKSIEEMYPTMARIHLFLDNARYHHAKLVQDWMNAPDRRIVLHFIPAYCPHLNPIERLWRVMHENITHNRCYDKFAEFCAKTLSFLREQIPKYWDHFRDSITDNFRVISPKDFRVMT
jgi:transposase